MTCDQCGAMWQAKEDIIEMLLEWKDEAESAGQSPTPIHFSMIVRDDITLRDALEIARGPGETHECRRIRILH